MAAALIWAATTLSATESGFDPSSIETIIGIKGAMNETEHVYKISVPRKDVPVTVDGWKMPPFMGLTSWAAFTAGQKAPGMVMGDLVLFEDEVNVVMSAALDHGLEVTALHNHFFYDQPRVYFMHIGGEGKITDLAQGVKAALDAAAATRAARSGLSGGFGREPLPSESAINVPALEAVLGAKAQQNSGMAKFVFGREVKMECGCTAGKEMGVNTWAAFAGNDGNAVVDGDFATTAGELQAVLKSLRKAGINIVAIHSHMTEESPRIIFLHYWGRGPASELATALKDTLAIQKK